MVIWGLSRQTFRLQQGPHITGSYCTQQPPKHYFLEIHWLRILQWKELSIPESTFFFCFCFLVVFCFLFPPPFPLFACSPSSEPPAQVSPSKTWKLKKKKTKQTKKKELSDCLFSPQIMLWILQEFIFPLDMFLYQSSCFIAYRCL